MTDAPGTFGLPPDGPRPSAIASFVASALVILKRKSVAIPLVLTGLVAFAWGWNPPTGTVHYFSKVGDYRPTRGSGCTNTGKGCHGTETSYGDFNAYHPNATCTTCHDYQGVGCIPCHSPDGHECTDCHDGSIEGIADVVKLTDPYPRGHYRESTHTAMGTDMRQVARVRADGKAGAECGACHSRDLRKSHTGVPEVEKSTYGHDIDCVECHNDTRAGSLKQVLDGWKKRRCEDCHSKTSSAPMHGVDTVGKVEGKSPLSCGITGSGCHPDNDLHALHPDTPVDCSGFNAKDGLGCHQLQIESHEPTATTCAGGSPDACHRAYLNDRYSHKNDKTLHAPKTTVPARDTSYYGTACGDCHRMAPNGTSLVDEHAIATSARTGKPSDNCRNCHNNRASAFAISDDWSDRDTYQSCSVCHGVADLPEAHETELRSTHSSAPSGGCASSGMGCHPTADLSQVGVPTPRGNLHATCLRCHDWRRTGVNMAYDPRKKTCGWGRDCHGAAGSYSPTSSVHAGRGGVANGVDPAHHIAGPKQSGALWSDPVSKTSRTCGACHSMVLGVEHARASASLASGPGNLCTRCHDHATAAATVVKGSWTAKNTTAACSACHGQTGVGAMHGGIVGAHAAVERDAVGNPQPGACVRSGCHATNDVRRLHRATPSGCATRRCHTTSGSPETAGVMSCGGADRAKACHTSIARSHSASHSADLTGTVNGITYGLGSNTGCFGCHAVDLAAAHSTALVGGSMQGGGATACAVCHEIADDPGAGAYASGSSQKNAIAKRDRRCTACHASGSATDGPAAVASPHKDTSTATPLPDGKVWADPFAEWKTAFDAPTGGGHNSLPFGLVGATRDKAFPVTTFTVGAATYVWALPPNTGDTAWLRTSVYGAAAESTESIQHITVACDDCHTSTAGMAGPQGAAVKVAIDPEYSQTEYANPTPLLSQWEATGTARVVCFKCHSIQAGSIPGTTAPGGTPAHAPHASHPSFPDYNPNHYGEKCIDCHIRIPHAWRRPRLLARTAVTADGAAPDVFPYVRATHDGLAGVRLRSFERPSDLDAGACATGGCHAGRSVSSHPMPADIPGADFWP
jgi:hypothetical protein